jgi:hypothetical protein
MVRRYIAYSHLFVLLFLVAACSSPDDPEDTPSTSVEGQLTAWGEKSHVDNRHIVLCRIEDKPSDGRCELMPTAAVTDDQGNFAISYVPAGSYFILYDSGLTDFDEALDLWGGEMLRFGDMDWLSEFLGVDLQTEPVEFRVPEGISHSPHQGWLTHYCTLTLSVGNSPFIIAHDMEKAQESRDLRCLIAEVTPGEQIALEIQAAYYGER